MTQEVNKTKIRNEIIQAAKYKKSVEYIMLSYLIGKQELDQQEIDGYLKQVSIDEHKDGKPILWPLVIEESTELPSERYFDLLKELEVIPNNASQKEKTSAFQDGKEAVFAYWSRRRKTGMKKRF